MNTNEELEAIYSTVKAAKVLKNKEVVDALLTEDSKCPSCGTAVKHVRFDGSTFHHPCYNCRYDASLYKISPFYEAHQYQLRKALVDLGNVIEKAKEVK